MIQVDPLTLEFNGVRLEPLSIAHADGLRAAASDGVQPDEPEEEDDER